MSVQRIQDSLVSRTTSTKSRINGPSIWILCAWHPLSSSIWLEQLNSNLTVNRHWWLVIVLSNSLMKRTGLIRTSKNKCFHIPVCGVKEARVLRLDSIAHRHLVYECQLYLLCSKISLTSLSSRKCLSPRASNLTSSIARYKPLKWSNSENSQVST